jgi:hypothetical protein
LSISRRLQNGPGTTSEEDKMIHWMRPRRAARRNALMTWTAAVGALALLADVRPAMPQTPLDLFRERTAMLQAGAQCRLFDGALTNALTASQAQARTTALRAGASLDFLDRAAADARAQVSAMACGSARVQQSAQRARDAYRAYGGLQRMSFPGEVGAWRADRAMPLKSASWRLSQDAWAGLDKVVFGLAGRNGAEAMTLSVASPDGSDPYAARLVMRDAARLPQPYVKPSGAPLSQRTPVRGAARVILAEAKAEADPALRPLGARSAVAFRFPAAAEQTLQGLDPREAVSLELLYPSARGDLVRTAFIEVGDFNAGVAFLKSAAVR